MRQRGKFNLDFGTRTKSIGLWSSNINCFYSLIFFSYILFYFFVFVFRLELMYCANVSNDRSETYLFSGIH